MNQHSGPQSRRERVLKEEKEHAHKKELAAAVHLTRASGFEHGMYALAILLSVGLAAYGYTIWAAVRNFDDPDVREKVEQKEIGQPAAQIQSE